MQRGAEAQRQRVAAARARGHCSASSPSLLRPAITIVLQNTVVGHLESLFPWLSGAVFGFSIRLVVMECGPIIVGYGGGRGAVAVVVVSSADSRSGRVPLQYYYRIWLWSRWNRVLHAVSDLSSDFREVEL